MLAKLTCRGRDFPAAVARAKRALAEFRIRGVSTNIPFLQAVLEDPAFVAGDLSTSFIDERPQLLRGRESQATAAPRSSTGSPMSRSTSRTASSPPPIDPASKLPAIDLDAPAPAGSRQRLLELGPTGLRARRCARRPPLAVTETTFRDAHQSLLATRVRTKDLVAVAPYVARMTPELLSVEAWGGATYDVALRFLGEDPWERLAALREALPNIAIQMLLRGRNTVGYTPYPTEVTDAFVREAAATGVDIFRIFDALNDVEPDAPGDRRGARDRHTPSPRWRSATRATCSTPPKTSTRSTTTCGLAEQIVDAGAHILAIKDMAGLLRPAAAEQARRRPARALRPAGAPAHARHRGRPARDPARREPRRASDAVDVASAPMAGTTSQPSPSALVAALAHTERDTGISLQAVSRPRAVLGGRAPPLQARSSRGCPGPTGRVYHHEIPGGQLSNLRQQAIALGLGRRLRAASRTCTPRPTSILGRVPKVTPSSKVVGDLALHLAAVKADPADFAENPEKYDMPDSVDRLHGRRARRPARRLARAVPHQGARGPRRAHRRHRAHRRAARRARGRQPHPPRRR